MSEIELSASQKRALKDLIDKSGVKISFNALISQFRCQNDKTLNRNLLATFQSIVRCDETAVSLFENNFCVDIQRGEPIQCLQLFLDAYIRLKRSQSRGSVDDKTQNASTSAMNESRSPAEQVTPKNMSEYAEKLKKVAAHSLRRSVTGIKDTTKIDNYSALLAHEPTRPHSRWYFNQDALDSLPVNVNVPACAALPLRNQEELLMDDLLYCFVGQPGNYIKPIISTEAEKGFASIRFKISDEVDVTLRNIAIEILPLASHHSIVQKFTQLTSQMENQVGQALSEILQEILNDYSFSIVQLETEISNNALNMHKLLHLVRPTLQSMEILVAIVLKIVESDLSAGTILSILYDEITLQTGNPKAQQMLVDLTERASVPYVEMLELWILKGVIIDVYNEFFVIDHGGELVDSQENEDTTRYWECRYTVKPDRVPRFLESDADIILRTGKYLNVIRQCGKQITPPIGLSKLEFSPTNSAHSTFIKNAYHNASKTLLELLVNENNLMGHISSVKRYFLLQQGDLITQFMDASEEELAKHVDKVAPVRLDNLLQLIVRLSSAKHDPCLEHLHCDLFTMDLATQMTRIHVTGGNYVDVALTTCDDTDGNLDLSGLECFVFKYNVQWPVSIVLNQWSLLQYQMLFRLLFYCKHVERQLCKVWIENTGISKSSPEVKDLWRCAFSLRQRMLNAIQHLEYYMMIEVIEPNWNIFTEKMKNVQNVDEVIAIHQDFLHVVFENCMLRYPESLRSTYNICKICLQFCDFITQSVQRKDIDDAWQKDVKQLDKEFVKTVAELLQGIGKLSSQSTAGLKLVNLVSRINFNGFYNQDIEQNFIESQAAN